MDMLAFSYKTGDFLSSVSCKCIIPMGLRGQEEQKHGAPVACSDGNNKLCNSFEPIVSYQPNQWKCESQPSSFPPCYCLGLLTT